MGKVDLHLFYTVEDTAIAVVFSFLHSNPIVWKTGECKEDVVQYLLPLKH